MNSASTCTKRRLHTITRSATKTHRPHVIEELKTQMRRTRKGNEDQYLEWNRVRATVDVGDRNGKENGMHFEEDARLKKMQQKECGGWTPPLVPTTNEDVFMTT